MKNFYNWLAALAIAVLMSCAYMLDAPSETEAAQDVAADLAQAKRDARDAKRRERWERAVEASYRMEVNK